MALITLILLVAFTMIYLARSLDNKPAWLTAAVDNIMAYIDPLSFWSIIYGLVALLMAALLVHTPLDIMVRLLANAMIILLALPYAFQKLVARFQGEENAAILESLHDIVNGITRHEKTAAFVAAGTAVVLFAVMFR